jgi:rhodanese-related sulfurtransferase
MLRITLQIFGFLVLSAAAGWISRSISGPIKREIPCDVASLKPGEICLATIVEKWKSDVLWVDARSKAEWQRDGVPGSVWITHENFDESLSNAATQMLDGKPVIVYCSAVGCDTSKEVANRIRSYHIASELHALHGGWKALNQAGLIKSSK